MVAALENFLVFWVNKICPILECGNNIAEPACDDRLHEMYQNCGAKRKTDAQFNQATRMIHRFENPPNTQLPKRIPCGADVNSGRSGVNDPTAETDAKFTPAQLLIDMIYVPLTCQNPGSLPARQQRAQ